MRKVGAAAMEKFVLFAAFASLQFDTKMAVTAVVILQQTSPSPVCPSDDVILNCTVTKPGAEVLWWLNPNNLQERILYSTSSINKHNETVGAFTTTFIDGDEDHIVSFALLLGIDVQDHGTEGITCRDSFVPFDEVTKFANLAGSPSAPIDVSLSATSVASVLLSWSPPLSSDLSCPPITYTIAITAAGLPLDPVVLNTTDNTTNKTVFGLTQGMEYSFTVAGVDAGGRVGESSMPSFLILEVCAAGAPVNVSSSVASMTFESVLLSWSPPESSNCPPATYTITITFDSLPLKPLVINTTDNTTNKTVSDLTQGLEYSFTVAGVDAEGRVGENSAPTSITIDVPQSVLDLNASVVDTTVTVTWMPPPPSSRPLLTGYKISHNITGTVVVSQTNITKHTVESVAPGVFLFTVLAINILGNGKERNITVTVQFSVPTSTHKPTEPSGLILNTVAEPSVIIILSEGTYLIIASGTTGVVGVIIIIFTIILLVFIKKLSNKHSHSQVDNKQVALSVEESMSQDQILPYAVVHSAEQSVVQSSLAETLMNVGMGKSDDSDHVYATPLPKTEGGKSLKMESSANKTPNVAMTKNIAYAAMN